jgi:GNAT superfamily N-acetyltransferase
MALSFMIRKYKPDDRKRCRALWRELTEWHREIYQDLTIGGPHPEDFFDKHLAEVGPDRLWVAVHDSHVVGLVGLIVKSEEAEIEPLVVSKAYRHKGLGEQLVKTVVYEACNIGVRFLNVRPVARNIQAINFLYQQGFKNLGHIELFLDFSDYTWNPGPQLFGCKFNF